MLRAIMSRPSTAAATVFLLLVALAAVLAPMVAPYDPTAQAIADALAVPSSDHLLGTDDLGRDNLSRLIWGARASLMASLVAVVVALAIGVPLGLVAGYWGRLADSAVTRVVDIVQSIPAIVLAITLTGALSAGLTNAMIAVGIVFSPIVVRLMRAQVMSVKEQPFIEAARSYGASTPRMVLREVLPNSLQPVVVQVPVLLAFALLAEAALSYLGFGVQPPTPSWGHMLGRAYAVIYQEPWQIFLPGLMISFTGLSFTYVGEGLRRAMGVEVKGAGEVTGV